MAGRFRFTVERLHKATPTVVDGNGASIDMSGRLVIADDNGLVLGLGAGHWVSVERTAGAIIEAEAIVNAISAAESGER